MSSFNVGLVGYGTGGKYFHSGFIKKCDGLVLRSVVTSRRDEVNAELPGVACLTSIDELLRDSQIQLIVITTPSNTHYDLGKKCLEAGRHCVIDKPICATYTEAKELQDIARSKNLLCTAYQNRRWDGEILTLKSKDFLGAETFKTNHISPLLGKVVYFESNFPQYKPDIEAKWTAKAAPAVGLLHNLGSHLVDQTIYLFGKPSHISAYVGCQRKESEVNDYFDIVLWYDKSGLIARLHSDSVTPIPPTRMNIGGLNGYIRIHEIDQQENQLRNLGMKPGDEGFGKNSSGILKIKGGDQQNFDVKMGNYIHFYDDVAKALRAERHVMPSIPPEETLLLVKILDLAVASSNQNSIKLAVEF